MKIQFTPENLLVIQMSFCICKNVLMRNNITLVHVHDNKHEDDINLLAKMLIIRIVIFNLRK